MRRFGWALLAILIATCAAAATPGNVAIRQGRHGTMGRLVFEFPGVEAFASHLNGSQLSISFTPALPIAAVPLRIPGMQSMQGGAGMVQLQLSAGAVPHVYRLGNRIVVDARSRLPERKTAQAAAPAAVSPRPIPAAQRERARPPSAMQAAATPAARPPPAAPPAAAQQAAAPPVAPAVPAGQAPAGQAPAGQAPAAPAAAAPAPAPAAVPAQPVAAPAVIDFAAQPGAAAFRRGNQAIIVFDTSEIPDITALQSTPLFAGASLVSLQNAQVISIPLTAADALALTPVAGGWQVAAIPAMPPAPPPPQLSTSAVEFPMQSANQSIIILDPVSGGDLLVGTVTQAGDAANFVESGPGYSVLPAWLGVAVIPEADNLGLNASLKGFELVSDAQNGLPLGTAPPPSDVAAAAPGAPGAGSGMSLPHGATADLWRKLVADQRTAALLPALGRLNAQITLAEDMLALGLGPESLGVLNTAVLENPAAQFNGKIAALRAVAGVLAHHSQPADFTAPGIIPGAENSFWRAVAALDQGQTAQAVPDLIAGLPRFETYPDALRNTVTAEIAEALADAGKLQAAQQLVDSDPENKLLDLARAKILERNGQAKAALAAYQALASSPDSRVAAIANDRAIEVQLAAGQLSAAQAADALDAQIFDWRDPEHERHLRIRTAELRAAAGQWPQAFTALAECSKLFPDRQADINRIRSALLLKMLKGNGLAQLSPIEAVAVLQQNQDLLPTDGNDAQLVDLLAQQLEKLNLPGVAAPMLSRLIQGVPQGPARARLGATLAQVDLDAGSPVAALADLSQTQADNLPPDLVTQRNVLAAKAQAAGGNAIAAVNALAPPPASAPAAGTQAASPPAADTAAGTPAAANPQELDAQAQIAEQSGQWPQAEQALSTLVSQTVPASGPISSDQESLLLRLATAASHNNDSATLASLGTQYAARVTNDAPGQMFQTLTAPPLTGDQGLNQALHEIAQLQALPAMVNAAASAGGSAHSK